MYIFTKLFFRLHGKGNSMSFISKPTGSISGSRSLTLGVWKRMTLQRGATIRWYCHATCGTDFHDANRRFAFSQSRPVGRGNLRELTVQGYDRNSPILERTCDW